MSMDHLPDPAAGKHEADDKTEDASVVVHVEHTELDPKSQTEDESTDTDGEPWPQSGFGSFP
jgi:hypothetical protein